MALLRRSTKGRRGSGRSPAAVGLIAAIVIVILILAGVTKLGFLSNPYEFSAVFTTGNNIQPKSPVRIAGVNVGVVKDVQPLPGGKGAKVIMDMQSQGLPLHTDAQLKIRPRIFLEGNFFIDLQPGSPSAPILKNGGTIPVNQTATPVQFGQLLTSLQANTRQNLPHAALRVLDQGARQRRRDGLQPDAQRRATGSAQGVGRERRRRWGSSRPRTSRTSSVASSGSPRTSTRALRRCRTCSSSSIRPRTPSPSRTSRSARR